MAQDSQSGGGQAKRLFEQPPDMVSFYSDYAQVVGTESEVVLQFYETIPGSPGPSGEVQTVRSRLRANIVIGKAHALNIGRLLLQHVGDKNTISPPGGKQP